MASNNSPLSPSPSPDTPTPSDPSRNDLQSMLNANAYRIADLLSQLEKSHAQLKRLRTRALKASGNDRAARRRSTPSVNITRTTKSTDNGKRNRNTNSQKIAPSTTTTTSVTSPTSIMQPNTTPTVLARGHWSPDEEKRFSNAVQLYGPTSYSDITKAVGSRTEKQVRDHAWRVRQKKGKAAQFAALAIPPFMLEKTMVPKLQKKPEEPDKEKPPSVIIEKPAMVLMDKLEDLPEIPEKPRPSSPFSAVSTDGTCPSSPRADNTKFELGELDLLSSATTAHDLIVEALFPEKNELPVNMNTSCVEFDWNCGPSAMEEFGDDLTDNFLLALEHV